MQDRVLAAWRHVTRRLARRSLRRRPVPVVAVTGSTGKTTTTAFIVHLMSGSRRVGATQGNKNLGWAIAATILGVPHTRRFWRMFAQLPVMLWRGLMAPHPADMFVLEVATDKPGDIPGSLRAFTPAVAVYTTVANAHVGNFSSKAALVAEKAALIRALPTDGHAVLSGDDPGVREIAGLWTGARTTYGFTESAEVRMTEPMIRNGALEVLLTDSLGAVPMRFPRLRHRQHLYAVMAAWAVGRVFGLDRMQMARRLEQCDALPGRGRVIELPNLLIIDEAYNASPAATAAALQSLAELADGRRRVAVLGDMKELGAESPGAHEAIGRAASRHADVLVAVGEWAPVQARAFREGGGRAFTYAAVNECLEARPDWLRPHDAVLVKGSNSVRLGRLVNALRVSGGAAAVRTSNENLADFD